MTYAPRVDLLKREHEKVKRPIAVFIYLNVLKRQKGFHTLHKCIASISAIRSSATGSRYVKLNVHLHCEIMALRKNENVWERILSRSIGKFYLPRNTHCNWFMIQLCSIELFLFYLPFTLEEFYIQIISVEIALSELFFLHLKYNIEICYIYTDNLYNNKKKFI